MPGLNIPTDFFRYIINKGLASFYDVGIRVSIPPRTVVPIEYAPTEYNKVWIVYYLSFGDIPTDVFAIRCKFKSGEFGGVLDHECRPCGRDVIDPGCILWCPLTKNCPYFITIENLTDEPQVFKARIWELRTTLDKMKIINRLWDAWVGMTSLELLEEVRRLRGKVDELIKALKQTRLR